MPAQITERPKRRNDRGSSADNSASAQILQFPTGAKEEPDPATALATIVQSLTKRQSVALGREVAVLSAAIAREVAASVDENPEGMRPRHSERVRYQARRRRVRLRPAVGGMGLVDLRQEEDSQDTAYQAGGNQMAAPASRPLRERTATSPGPNDARRDRLRMARNGEGRRNPQPLGQALQAKRIAHARVRLPPATNPRPRHELHERHRARRPPRSRSRLAEPAQREQGSTPPSTPPASSGATSTSSPAQTTHC